MVRVVRPPLPTVNQFYTDAEVTELGKKLRRAHKQVVIRRAGACTATSQIRWRNPLDLPAECRP